MSSTLALRPKPKATSKENGSSLSLPYENYIGAVLGHNYRITSLWSEKDHLDIYAVTDFDEESFEAQAFTMRDLSEKMLESRKRRMKRLCRSENFVCEIRQAEKWFLVSRRNHTRRQPSAVRKSDGMIANALDDDQIFPALVPALGSDDIPSRPNSSLSESSRCSTASTSSYAEAAWKALERNRSPLRAERVGKISTTLKGSRQRKKRQRRRDERR